VNKDILISVIIANYNKQRYVTQCLNSVLAQTYDNIEIIIVDDCSTDESLKLLRKYEQQHSIIKVFVNEKNSGVSKTRMNAISKATGEYITVIDADDYYISDSKLENEMNLISKFKKEHNKDIIAFSNYRLLDGEGVFQYSYAEKFGVRTGNIINFMFLRKYLLPIFYLMSKHQYYSVGGYDEKFPIYEDTDLEIRLASKYEFHYTGCDGFARRETKKGLSSAKIGYKKKWQLYMRKKNFHLLKKDKFLIIANSYFEYIISSFLQYTPESIKQIIKRFINFGKK
jgi:glycosyltransferase involved in cell wall biosynthesis